MKKLIITASFLLVLLGTAFCVNKIYDIFAADAGTQVMAVEAVPVYMSESSGLAPLEAVKKRRTADVWKVEDSSISICLRPLSIGI